MMVGGLLVGTATAFALTEELKLQKSALTKTHVTKVFSPTCRCATRAAHIQFVLRRPGLVTVQILDARQEVVTVLGAGRRMTGVARYLWDGKTSSGASAHDGRYAVSVHVQNSRTYLLPNRISLDTSPPRLAAAMINRTVFSLSKGKNRISIKVSYRLTEPAHAVLYLNGEKILGPTYRHRIMGVLAWNGVVHGRHLPRGEYVLEIGGIDVAGNPTPAKERAKIRFLIR